MHESVSYKDAGVNIEKGEALVDMIKTMVKSTYSDRVYDGVGGFASLFDIGNGKLLAAGADGVGTKLKIAQLQNIHHTIGIDLVAMCVNDILCTGARPLFFLDYLSTGKLDLTSSKAIIEGIVEGCKQSRLALIGGETAEMPGMYADGAYDLAGFAIGEVRKDRVISGKTIHSGDSLVGIASTGVHANGFSLVRKLIGEHETDLLKDCLVPTKIYVDIVTKLVEEFSSSIKGMAHITGGGISNIDRINPAMDYTLNNLPSLDEIPSIFSILKERSGLADSELYRTFNMGIGFVIATDRPNEVCASIEENGDKCWILGAYS